MKLVYVNLAACFFKRDGAWANQSSIGFFISFNGVSQNFFILFIDSADRITNDEYY